MSYARPLRSSSTIRHLWRDDNRRMVGLDLLRSAAILSVVVTHYSMYRPFPIPFYHYGWVGVDLFFVLSGYLIGGQLLSLQLKHRSIPLKTFYMRRLLRTLPNYYVALALYLAIPALSPFMVKGNLVLLWQYVTFTQNLPRQLPFFQISWSLCVEEHFYLLLPLIVCWFLKRERKRVHWVFPLVILGELLLRGAILYYGQQNLRLENRTDALAYMGYIYYPTYCRLDGLTLGVALAAMRLYRPELWSRLMARGNQLLLAGLIGLSVSVILMTLDLYAFVGTINFTVLAISFSLITASAVSPHCILGRVRLRAITVLAELAYAIYLTHRIALYLADSLLSKWGFSGYNGLSFIFTILAVLMMAFALFALVERPCLKLRDRRFAYKNPETATSPTADISPVEAPYILPATSPTGR